MNAKASKKPKQPTDAGHPPPALPVLLTFADLARLLQVTDRHVRSLVASGQFPPADLRVGTRPRWKAETLNRWIESKG